MAARPARTLLTGRHRVLARARGTSRYDHRVYAAIYALLARQGERTVVGRLRTSTLRPARGRLVIVGLGPGQDLGHIPTTVDSVVAVEPSRTMLRKARRRAELLQQRIPVLVLGGVAEQLPLRDASADAVLCSFVLCSVQDMSRCLQEFRRVLRPGGQLLVLEHVAAPAGSRTRRVQDLLDRVWPRLAGGCHLSRDVRAELVAAGFDDDAVHCLRIPAIPICLASLTGVARMCPWPPASRPYHGPVGHPHLADTGRGSHDQRHARHEGRD